MPCCKAEVFGWCTDLAEEHQAVYTDDEGNQYCVFHAPQGKKGISLKNFNNLVFERIDQIIDENAYLPDNEKKSCDLSNTVFEGDIDFSQYSKPDRLPQIYFFKAEFSGEAVFSGVEFSGEAVFSGAQFSGKADFSGTHFSEVSFKKSTFSGEANFYIAEFRKKAVFLKAKFRGKSDFKLARFIKEADFRHAQFSHEVFFSGVSTFPKCELAMMGNMEIGKKILFEDVNLFKVSFIGSDMRMMDFTNCDWPSHYGRDVLFDEIYTFGIVTYDEEHKKYKKFIDRLRHKAMQNLAKVKNRFRGGLSQTIERELKGFKRDIYLNSEVIKKVEILYRQLKQKYKDEHNDSEVSPWHYGEKEMYRKGSFFRRYFPLSLSNLYWISSGYGERPARAGIVLILLLISVGILFGLIGLDPAKESIESGSIYINNLQDIFNLKVIRAILLNSFQFVTFEKTPDFVLAEKNYWGSFLTVIFRIIFPIQAALFALAVRNRFRR